MRSISRLFLVPAAIGGFVVLQCGGGDPTPGSPLTPPDIPGGGCDASKTVSEGGCDVSDQAGIFVSPTGSDTNPGTKALPFKTVQAGINAAKKETNKRDVYVCEGTYDEAIVLDGATQGVALHGGFACADWSYKETKVALAPSKAGYAVKITGSASVIETFEIRAKDGDVPGASSIAVYVEAAPGMTFRRVKIFAGKGAKGADGTAGVPYANPAQKGADMVGPKAGLATTCTCGSASTTGGQGGGGTQPSPTPAQGLPLVSGASATAGAPYPVVGNQAPCNPLGTAGAFDGATGPSADVVKGASGIGLLSSQGWAPAGGETGREGGIGQGGGGASGRPDMEGGGGGGCGGCGGKGGTGGGGGGASIGIASLNSVVRVQSSTITTSDGGDGGKGGDGGAGQLGGGGGIGTFAILPYCKGGTGGQGGPGSGGGGGAGGSSLGIIVVGSKELDVDKATSFVIGSAKPGGAGGGPKGSSGGFGIDGFAAAILGNQ